MQTSNPIIALSQTYEPYQLIVVIIGVIYSGFYVMVSNHYIFKPKIQKMLSNRSISSESLQQIIVDFLTNLSSLTFILCSILIYSSDKGISTMIISDMHWSGIFLAIIAYKKIKGQDEVSNTIFLKNIFFLILVYLCISFHYLTTSNLISLGLCLIFFYLLNLTLNAYGLKFTSFLHNLFKIKTMDFSSNKYEHKSNMTTIDYLSKNFRPTSSQLGKQLSKYSIMNDSNKIKTQEIISQNLLKIALAVHLSKQKFEDKMKKDVRDYFGSINGTSKQKTKRLQFYNKITNQSFQSLSDHPEKEIDLRTQSENSCIFYVLPVKIFENFPIISVLFSITINLGYGFFLATAVEMTSTIQNGYFLQLIYAFLLLPIIPQISKRQFFNSMTLSSLWKYCLVGLFVCINCLQNGSMNFALGNFFMLKFIGITQSLMLVAVTIIALQIENASYKIVMVFILTMVFNICLTFLVQ